MPEQSPPLRILLVDDNPDDRRLTLQAIRQEFPEASVYEVETAEQFDKALTEPHLSLAITDCELRWSDGLALFSRLHEKFPHLPVIMLTGSETEGIAVEAMKRGIDECVLKTPKHMKLFGVTLRHTLQHAKTERDRKQREMQYRLLLERLQDGVMVSDQGIIQQVNPVAVRMWKYVSAEEMIGLPVWNMASPESRDTVRNYSLGRTADKSVPELYEFRALCKDSTTFECEVSVTVIPTDSGRLAMGILRDITERKQAEVSMRESEEKYRNLVVNSLQGILALQDNRIVFANPAFAAISSYSVEELLSLSPERVMEMIHPEDRALVWGRFRDRLAGKEVPPQYEYRAIRKDGSIVWLEMYAGRTVFEGKPAIQLLVVDITERKRAEEEIRRARDDWSNIFESISDVVVVLDRDHQILDANHAGVFALQQPKDKIIGCHCFELFHCSDHPPDDCPHEKLLRSAHPETVEMEMEVFNGTYLVSVSPIFNGAGKIEKTIHIAKDITSRKLAEKAFKQSEERLRLALTAAKQGLYDSNIQNGEAFVTPEYAQMLGYDPAEFHETNQKWIDRLHPDDREPIGEIYRAYIRGEIPEYRVEFRQRTASGGWKWILSIGSIIERDAMGNPLRMLGTHTDITERKLAERDLEKSLSLLRATLESTADGILVVNREGKIETHNQRFLEMWRIPDSEMATGEDDRALAYVLGQLKDPETFLGKVRELYAKPDATSFDLLEFKDGRVFERFSQPQRIGGKNIGRVWSFRDITERKRAEDTLRESEEKYRLHFQNVGDVVYTVDTQLRITSVSPSVEVMVGYRPDELVGGTVAELNILAPEHLETAIANMRRVFAGEQSGPTEYEFVCKDGSRKWGEATGAPLMREGKIVGVISVARDITRHKLLEEQLRQSQKLEAVGNLAGGIAHDFNNLLTVILGRAQMGLMKLSPESLTYQNLREIQMAGERAAELTGQLLAFSRKQMLQPKAVNLNETLTGMTKMLSRLIREDIQLETRFVERLWNVMVDPGQMQQVIINLVVNARDAMPESGRLFIETSNVNLGANLGQAPQDMKPGRYVMLSIADTGFGMSREVQKHIFEPFFTTKPTGKGTGLGLSVAYGILKQHDGSILVHSEEGKGTTFEVYLPAVDVEVEREPVTKKDETMPGGLETILFAEDNETIRSLAVTILSELGYTVWDAPNGAKALELLAKHGATPHLLITDVIMPEMGGKELATEYRRRFPGAKILFISGYASGVKYYQKIIEPMGELLMKPFTPADLAKKVRTVLDENPE